jgi:hypothetical protein
MNMKLMNVQFSKKEEDMSKEEIGQKLTEDCEKVSNWMRSNKLKLNPGKTHVMTVGTSQRLRLLE